MLGYGQEHQTSSNLLQPATPYVTPTRTGALLSHSSGGSFSLEGRNLVEFSPHEMLEYFSYIQRYSAVSPRTDWCKFPFFIIISKFKQKYCLGYRPEDLANIEIIEQKAWKKHLAHMKRLENFPLDKAEYYLRLKESHVTCPPKTVPIDDMV